MLLSEWGGGGGGSFIILNSPLYCVVIGVFSSIYSKEERTEFQKFKRNLSFALERLIDEIHFIFHYVASNFYSKATFSVLDFEIASYTDDDGRNQVALTVNNLFRVETKPEDIKALKFIRNGRSKPWPPVNFTHLKKAKKK